MMQIVYKFISDLLIIYRDESTLYDTGHETDPLMHAVKKLNKHTSIFRIRKSFKYPTKFSFVLQVDQDIIAKEIKNLNPKKATAQDDMLVKLLKMNNDIFFQYLSHIFNECIEKVSFSSELKFADKTSVHKK